MIDQKRAQSIPDEARRAETEGLTTESSAHAEPSAESFEIPAEAIEQRRLEAEQSRIRDNEEANNIMRQIGIPEASIDSTKDVLNKAEQLVMEDHKPGEAGVENIVADVDEMDQLKLEAKFDPSKYESTVKAITELTKRATNLDQNQLEAEVENINRSIEIFNEALHEENHKNQALSKIHQIIKNGYNLDVPEVMNLGVNIAERNLDVLSVESGDPEWVLKDKLNIISKLLQHGNELKTNRVVEALVKSSDPILRTFRDSNSPREYSETVELLLEYGNEEVADQCESAIKDLMEKSKNSQNKQPLLLIGSLCESGIEKVASKARDILGQELRILGLEDKKFIEAWLNSSDTMESAVATNLPAIYELEAEKPGESISKTLFEQFGICNFGRYPKDLLLNQFEQRNNDTQPYGIAIYPYSDSQAYFYDSKLVFEDL